MFKLKHKVKFVQSPIYIKAGLQWLESVVSLELPAPLPDATEPTGSAGPGDAAAVGEAVE